METIEIQGVEIQVRVGSSWRLANEDNCPANIVEEIAAEILDGGVEETSGYTASNGLVYRW